MRQKVRSGTKWEEKIAYSRAMKVGNLVVVSGTTAVDAEGNVVGENDMYAQSKFVLQKVLKALEQCGATAKDVIRTRIFLTDIGRFEETGRAHKEVFAGIDPVTSFLEVSALLDPRLLVEIEVDAIVGDP